MTGFPPPYSAQTAFSLPARETAEFWRTASGTVLGFALYLSIAWTLAGFLMPLAGGAPGTASYALVQLVLIGVMGVAAWLVTITLHRRPGWTLLGPLQPALGDFRKVLIVQFVLLIPVGVVTVMLAPYALFPSRPPGLWLLTLPLGLIAVLVQVSGEELVFRGYLQQQLAARLPVSAFWMGIPSALFAFAHYAPEAYGSNALWIVLWSGAFGIAMADLTARSGTLGAAIAVHFAMNAWAILLVSLPGPLAGLTLYVVSFGHGDEAMIRALLPVDFLTLLVSWLAARLALRR